MGLNIASYINNVNNNGSILLIIQKANQLNLTNAHSKRNADVKKWQQFYDYLYDPSTGPFRFYEKHSEKKQRQFAREIIVKICERIAATVTDEASTTNLQQSCKTFLEMYNASLSQKTAQDEADSARKRARVEPMDVVTAERNALQKTANVDGEGVREQSSKPKPSSQPVIDLTTRVDSNSRETKLLRIAIEKTHEQIAKSTAAFISSTRRNHVDMMIERAEQRLDDYEKELDRTQAGTNQWLRISRRITETESNIAEWQEELSELKGEK